jgi:hypothetical protein
MKELIPIAVGTSIMLLAATSSASQPGVIADATLATLDPRNEPTIWSTKWRRFRIGAATGTSEPLPTRFKNVTTFAKRVREELCFP